MNINDFSYTLPPGRIACFPPENPGDSKLLICNGGRIDHSPFGRLSELMESGETMVFNNTRVIQARITMKKPTGSKIEIFLLEPLDPSEYSLAFTSASDCLWKCMTGNKKKWKGGRLEKFAGSEGNRIMLAAEMVADHGAWQEINFSWEPRNTPFGRVIDSAGLTPIPPYLDRAPTEVDRERYQTVYSRVEGSVAAPTAGLHFTEEIMKRLKKKGVRTAEVTLHVGAGTFQPVRVPDIEQHHMHAEYFSVDADTIEILCSCAGKTIAVGTTSVRTLESLYWLGVKRLHYGEDDPFPAILSQWEIRDLPQDFSAVRALEGLLEYLGKNNKKQLEARTQLMIIPGYRFRMVNKLITNFHQPGSTLLLLIAAFIGDDWRKVYDYAMKNNFRFLSYGDSSLLIP